MSGREAPLLHAVDQTNVGVSGADVRARVRSNGKGERRCRVLESVNKANGDVELPRLRETTVSAKSWH